MSKFLLLPVRPAQAAALALAPAVLFSVAPARAETRAGVRVAAEVSADSRPFLALNRSGDVAGGIRLSPFLLTSSDRTTLNLNADVSTRRFTSSANGTETNANAGAEITHRFSPYTSLFGGGRYSNVRNGIGFGNSVIVGPDTPLPPITTPLPDVSLIGNRVNTQTASVNLGVSTRLSPLDQLSVTGTASRSTTSAALARNFNYLNGGVTYSRTLSSRVSLNANVTYGKSDFIGTRIGDGSVVSPTIGVRLALSPRLTVDVSGGVTFTDSTVGPGAKLRTTQLAGSLNLCRSEDRGSLCVSAARTAQPTLIGGIQTLSSVAVSYAKRLAERDSFRLDLQYNGNSPGKSPQFSVPSSRLYNASASWVHSFNQRLSLDVTPSYSRIHNFQRSFDNVRLLVSLRYSFGAIS